MIPGNAGVAALAMYEEHVAGKLVLKTFRQAMEWLNALPPGEAPTEDQR